MFGFGPVLTLHFSKADMNGCDYVQGYSVGLVLVWCTHSNDWPISERVTWTYRCLSLWNSYIGRRLKHQYQSDLSIFTFIKRIESSSTFYLLRADLIQYYSALSELYLWHNNNLPRLFDRVSDSWQAQDVQPIQWHVSSQLFLLSKRDWRRELAMCRRR